MRNKILISAIAVFLIAVGVKVYGNSIAVTEQKEGSDLVTVSEATFINETAKGLVLVDFWAPWCPPCRKMNPILEEVAKDNKGVAKIAKLNIDDNKQLATNKKVESIPTIIVYKDGKEVDRVIGLVDKAHLQKVIDTYKAK